MFLECDWVEVRVDTRSQEYEAAFKIMVAKGKI